MMDFVSNTCQLVSSFSGNKSNTYKINGAVTIIILMWCILNTYRNRIVFQEHKKFKDQKKYFDMLVLSANCQKSDKISSEKLLKYRLASQNVC